MKESFKLVGALTGICLVSALLVSIAHEVTKGPVEETEKRLKQEAVFAVLPEGASGLTTNTVSVVWADGTATTHAYSKTDKGYAMEMVAPDGYSGEIRLMLGFALGDTFWSYKVLAHTETPGLGAHITGAFIDHVRERPAFETKWKTTKDGGEIEPITSATISSRAVCDAIAHGSVVYKAIRQQETIQ